MLISAFQIVLTYCMAALLLANSLVILVNIFDFPPTGIRHLVSFVAAAGFVVALVFIMATLWRSFGFPKRS